MVLSVDERAAPCLCRCEFIRRYVLVLVLSTDLWNAFINFRTFNLMISSRLTQKYDYLSRPILFGYTEIS